MPWHESRQREGVVSDGGQQEAGRQDRQVIRLADYLRGQLGAFQRKVDRALALIADAAALGRVGVSVSGGKDSTVLLHLVRHIVPDAPAGFFDDGAQLQDTYDFLATVPNLDTVKVEPDLLEMCRIAGYWGHVTSTPEVDYNFNRKLIDEPSAEFARQHGLSVQAIGLRADESTGRWYYARRFGRLYRRKGSEVWNLCPLLGWSVEDIWAYVAINDLPYNRVYDKMAQLGLKREEMRVAPVLGDVAADSGRFAYLKQLDLSLWNRLVADFPSLTKYA